VNEHRVSKRIYLSLLITVIVGFGLSAAAYENLVARNYATL
jgi:hypothetical protein